MTTEATTGTATGAHDAAGDARPRRLRGPWVAAGVLAGLAVALVVALVLAAGTVNGARGDPRNAGVHGTMALSELLAAEGVEQQVLDGPVTASTVRGATVVLTDSDRLTADQLDRLVAMGAARVVLPDVAHSRLRPLLGTRVAGAEAGDGPVAPRCDLPAAVKAGDIHPGAYGYAVRDETDWTARCYPANGGYQLLVTERGSTEVVVVTGITANGILKERGAAALAMMLLGSHPRLVWWTPPVESPADVVAEPELVPPWYTVALLQSFVALVVVALWRGRRLGPLLPERLPAVVRASETVEGHARLYEAVSAAPRAAGLLRAAARRRLSRRYGTGGSLDSLVTALSTRTGLPEPEVRHLLAGPPPTDDDQLADLKRRLDDLERKAQAL